MTLQTIKRLLIALLLLGITGTILFFPFNFNNRYTCLYHRLFAPSEPVMNTVSGGHEQAELSQNISDEHAGHLHHSGQLIPHYLHHFAFLWWGSLLLLACCIFIYRKKNLSKTILQKTKNINRSGISE